MCHELFEHRNLRTDYDLVHVERLVMTGDFQIGILWIIETTNARSGSSRSFACNIHNYLAMHKSMLAPRSPALVLDIFANVRSK